MKMTKTQKQYFILGIVLLIASLFALQNLSLQPISCSGDKIYLEARSDSMASVVPSCLNNPYGGFAGKITYYAISPSGTEQVMGGYEASEASTQKISCGYSYQSGKGFAGKYVPNEGQGTYSVIARGYYVDSSGSHSFEVDVGNRYSACIPPDATCSDGTPLNACSANRPLKCEDYFGKVDLVPRSECGCDGGFEYKSGSCVPVEQPLCSDGDAKFYTCNDGTKVVSAVCSDGKYVNKAYECPKITEETDTETTTTTTPSGTTQPPTQTGGTTVSGDFLSNLQKDKNLPYYFIGGSIVLLGIAYYIKMRG